MNGPQFRHEKLKDRPASRVVQRRIRLGVAPAIGPGFAFGGEPWRARHLESAFRASTTPGRAVTTSLRLCAAVLLPLALLLAEHAVAREAATEPPEHATATRYGGRWNCDHGYQESNGSCAAVSLPANAYATDSSYGSGWACRRGFREIDETCVAVVVPANAYLIAGRGDAWKCSRGFRQAGESCIAIDVPANGFLSTSLYGSGWDCERGYKAVGETCIALVVPDNAHVNHTGNGWSCNRPYRKARGVCELP